MPLVLLGVCSRDVEPLVSVNSKLSSIDSTPSEGMDASLAPRPMDRPCKTLLATSGTLLSNA